MLQALFKSELKRTLPSNLLIAGAGMGALFAIDRILLWYDAGSSGSPRAAAALGVMMLFLSAFGYGAKAFGQLKDKHYSFLWTLPASRASSWATIVIANLSGAAAIGLVMGMYVVSRYLTDLAGEDVAAMILLYFVLFFLGCCMVLLFTRAAYAAGAGMLVFVAGGGLFAVTAGYLGSAAEVSLPAFVMLGVYLFLLAILSFSEFIRAEFGEFRVRMRGLGILVGSLMVFGAVCVATVDSGILASSGEWSSKITAVAVTPDGRFVALLHAHRKFPAYTRAEILDAANGNITAQFVGNGFSFPIWSADGTTLNLVGNKMRDAAPSLMRVSREGRLKEKFRMPYLTRIQAGDRFQNSIQYIGWRPDTQFILKAGETTGGLELSQAAAANGQLFADSSGFSWDSNFSLAGLTRSLQQRAPAPPGESGSMRGAYAFPVSLTNPEAPILYVRCDTDKKKLSLLVHRPQSGWRTVFDELPANDATIKKISESGDASILSLGLTAPEVVISSSRRLIAYRREEHGVFSAYIYDFDQDKTTTLGTIDDELSRRGIGRIYRSPVKNVWLVWFSGPTGFVYSADGLSVKQISIASPPGMLWLDKEGNRIFLDKERLFYQQADGHQRRLWPAAEPVS